MPHPDPSSWGVRPTRQLPPALLASRDRAPGPATDSRRRHDHHRHRDTRDRTAEDVDPEEVAERIIGILNDGAICVLASIGHELGLFETLGALPPATSAQIADAAGLDERYVREWLGGMVTACFVEYVPVDRPTSSAPTTRRSSPVPVRTTWPA